MACYTSYIQYKRQSNKMINITGHNQLFIFQIINYIPAKISKLRQLPKKPNG